MAEWKTPKNDYHAGSQVTPDIFNTLAENERYLQEVKIVIDQVQDAIINSTESASRENIAAARFWTAFATAADFRLTPPPLPIKLPPAIYPSLR